MADMATVLQIQVMGITVQALDAVYDNSKPFSTYLTKEGLSSILKKMRLRLKDNHTVVSRVRLPLLSLGNATERRFGRYLAPQGSSAKPTGRSSRVSR